MSISRATGLPIRIGGLMGHTVWGPLPDSELVIVWGGPGDPLLLTPDRPGCPAVQIMRPATYRTRAEAERAVLAFMAAAGSPATSTNTTKEG